MTRTLVLGQAGTCQGEQAAENSDALETLRAPARLRAIFICLKCVSSRPCGGILALKPTVGIRRELSRPNPEFKNVLRNHLLNTTVSLDRLRALRRRYVGEEMGLFRAVERAQADLDRWSRTQCLLAASCEPRESTSRNGINRYDGLATIERDLADARAAIRGLDEEIHDLEVRQIATHRPKTHNLHRRLTLPLG